MVVLDTNVVSELMRHDPGQLKRYRGQLRDFLKHFN